MKFEIIEEGRLDQVLSHLMEMSRSKVQKLIKEGAVLVNGMPKGASYKVVRDDLITITELPPEEGSLVAQDIPLDIVFEDEHMIILNKPSGLVVHPAAGHNDGTLVNALLYHYQLSKQEGLRPGIVHRLDKDTSGLMMVAKDDETHEALTEMLKRKEVKRTYIALVEGVIPHETGTIDAPIGRDPANRLRMKVTSVNAKEAKTHFKVLQRFKEATLIECRLETGRTHQIRVHLAYIDHPVVNDPIYGLHKKTTSFGQMLHSKRIELIEPITNQKLVFECDPPVEFNEILKSCEK